MYILFFQVCVNIFLKMTKKNLIDALSAVPDESEIDVYDLDGFTHPAFRLDTEKYFDYDSGLPIPTFEIGED